MRYKLSVKIDSEAIFNSGESDGNAIQMKVLTDEEGFVYYHSKTLKGQLKDKAIEIFKEYEKLDNKKARDFLKVINELFGFNEEECKFYDIDTRDVDLYRMGTLKVGHLQLDDETKDFFKQWFQLQGKEEYNTFSKHELVKGQTKIRINIAIEKAPDKRGVVKKGGLVNFHTVREGLTFYSDLIVTDIYPINCKEKENIQEEKEVEIEKVLKLIVKATRRIGANTHRGRGLVTAKITNKKGEEI